MWKVDNLKCIIVLACCSIAVARQSVWNILLDETSHEHITIFPNYMFQDSFASLTILCKSSNADSDIQVQWVLEEVDCMQDMYSMQAKVQETIFNLISSTASVTAGVNGSSAKPPPTVDIQSGVQYKSLKFQVSKPQVLRCGDNHIIDLEDESDKPYYLAYVPVAALAQSAKQGWKPEKLGEISWKLEQKDIDSTSTKFNHRVVRVWKDGMYHLLLSIIPVQQNTTFTAKVYLEMRGEYGYLSAINWPMLPYSGIMSILYLSLGTAWIIIWARSHQHSYKIHIAIGAVAVAGAMTNTMQFVFVSILNANGRGILGLRWLVLALSAAQEALTQLLLLIVATGYGITRPELSKKIIYSAMVLAAISFVASAIMQVAFDEDLKIKYTHPYISLGAAIIYGIDIIITGGWIMVAAILAFIHLCSRKHAKRKILVFSIFMSTCIVIFIANIIMSALNYGFAQNCWTDWKHQWVFQCLGYMDSLVLVIVLMWLWRPVDESQSYAFTPLATTEQENEEEDDEDEEYVEATQEKIKLEPL